MAASPENPQNKSREISDPELVSAMIDFAPIGLVLINADSFSILRINKQAAAFLGNNETALIGVSLLSLMPELGERVTKKMIHQAFATGFPLTFSSMPFSPGQDINTNPAFYADIKLQPAASYNSSRVAVVSINDQTERVKSTATENQLAGRERSFLERAPIGTGLYIGQALKIELANITLLGYWGKGSGVIGKSLEQVMPELIGQPFIRKLREVLETGRPYAEKGARAEVFFEGAVRVRYFDISYTPVFDRNGNLYGVLDMALDVTDSLLALNKALESEQFAQTIFYNSPVAKLVYTGEDMVLRQANEKMLKIFGRDSSIIGKPLFEAIPELTAPGRIKRYLRVLHTGEMQTESAEKIELFKNGESYTGYYDYTYKALRNTSGAIYGVMCTAIEVTEKVQALERIKEQEAFSRGAIELAELGTWSIDARTLGLKYSDRLIEWFGFDPKETEYQNVIPVIQPEDQARIAAAVAKALDPASDGVYDEIYTVVQPKTQRKLILHAQGRAIRNNDGTIVRMIGTAKDITAQRERQLALENEVQIRTEELAATIAKLNAVNVEMIDANAQLVRSNEELEQYAHVASHDLQEPIRKIMIYTGMVSDESGLSQRGQELIDKIGRSAGRMKQLISDLLIFSRLLHDERITEPVDLNVVLSEVLEDFEVAIKEKKAIIDIAPLPIINAVKMQMIQLFYNLISNALKFTKSGTPPNISVSCSILPPVRLNEFIPQPVYSIVYHHIIIADNGVGFKSDFKERIFDVFKRLHTKEEYPGSGIGLSVCRRIVLKHKGNLFAESVEGKGTQFHIILPASQTMLRS